MDKLSAPGNSVSPVVQASDLYVRQTYKDLFDEILKMFENSQEKQIVVTGTPGIGKSVFLIYLAIRLLAESDDDNPPIIIFHTKWSDICFVFGGCSTVRSGNIKDFTPFLTLTDTWYFVDSAPEPVLDKARTVVSVSPKTLFSEDSYLDIDKDVAWRYYMAPWNLEELKKCRSCVEDLKVVPLQVVEELYSRIGGVPRYVLARPKKELRLYPNNLEGAKEKSCERLVQALGRVEDPVMMMQLFVQGKDSLDFSSRLVHRWPKEDHRSLRLEWASTHVAEEVATLLDEYSCTRMLKMLINKPYESASGIIFEAYVLRTFRDGGHTFELKDLQTGKSVHLNIPRSPKSQYQKPTPSKDHRSRRLSKASFQHHWIATPKEARLIFVVPSHVYADFRKQDYLTSAEKVYENVPADIKPVKQYVLKIDVKAAATGQSPGLEVSVQRNPPRTRKQA
ncbi:hypothetical protein MVEG_10738 [Podila verticillata NRRL 6337]|nr:hypothetical protein MVEG_10738 [Podila verticillata NRRL 6337]